MKNSRISIRFNEKDLIEIEEMARKHGYDVSKYIRFCVQSTMKNESIPKSEVIKLMHLLLSNSDFMRIRKLSKHVKERYEQWM